MRFLEYSPVAGLLGAGILLGRVRGATVSKTIPVFKECGERIDGICAEGTRCSPGAPSFCLPLDSYINTTHVDEITGYGRPIAEAVAADDPPIPVFVACKDAEFSGECIQWNVACDFCVPLDSGWQNVISSVRIVDDRVGCNFWVSPNCQGDGINVPFSNPIFNLAATNYNDRITAFNCYKACGNC
ncbi:hypothetical protein PM082_016362 [Marasmius tenuissimus]|nr:hypothetical protein PM082_016362 [Marasmius tenuissimus]